MPILRANLNGFRADHLWVDGPFHGTYETAYTHVQGPGDEPLYSTSSFENVTSTMEGEEDTLRLTLDIRPTARPVASAFIIRSVRFDNLPQLQIITGANMPKAPLVFDIGNGLVREVAYGCATRLDRPDEYGEWGALSVGKIVFWVPDNDALAREANGFYDEWSE